MSAGTPQRNKRQAQAQRQAYMNSLRLEASNIQKNYNANEIYKATGTASIPKATENPTERGSSMEGRKQLIKEAIVSAGIMNSFVADNFLADMSDDDLTFFLSHQQAILEGFKPKNVPAPVFRAYFRKYQKKFGETLGIEYGLQTGGGADFGLDATLMLKAITENRDSLVAMKEQLDRTFDKQTASQYKGQVDALLAKMPTQEEFERIQQIEDADAKEEALRALSQELESIGDLGDLQQRFDELDRSNLPNDDARIGQVFGAREQALIQRQQQQALQEEMARVRDANKMTKRNQQLGRFIAQQVKQSKTTDYKLPENLTPNTLYTIAEQLGVSPDILESGDADAIKNAVDEAVERVNAGLAPAPESESDEEPVAVEGKVEGDLGVSPELDDGDIPPLLQEAYARHRDDIPSWEEYEGADADERDNILGQIQGMIGSEVGNDAVFPVVRNGNLYLMSADEFRTISTDAQRDTWGLIGQRRRRPQPPLRSRPSSVADQMADTIGAGMRGRGLGRSKPKTPVEKSDGYEKPVQYTQFGRYLIHHPKLKQGILQMKTPKGGAIKALPSEYLTPRLKDTMLTLVGNGSPSLEQFDRLTADEKEKLHHITKHSQYEKVSIPRGHMDKEDQMLHKFTILKGELLAGNNSKQLLKEFKSMLIKFVEEGRIPKRQAHEILVELAKEGM
jgi:hypothetical protein